MRRNSNGYNSIFNIVMIILIFILICVFIVWVHKGCARMNNNMVHIDDKYSYEKETHIIYQESWNWFTRTLQFRPYYDDNGNLYKFDESTDTWIIVE